jgi:hypothetical protein
MGIDLTRLVEAAKPKVPAKTQLSFSVDTADAEKLDAYCEAQGIERNNFLRVLVGQAVAQIAIGGTK